MNTNAKHKHEHVRGTVLGQLQNLHAMLHDMAERGQAISSGCRRYWTGRYEQLLDTGYRLGVIHPSEDTSWRHAFRTTLTLLTDTKGMLRARREYQCRAYHRAYYRKRKEGVEA